MPSGWKNGGPATISRRSRPQLAPLKPWHYHFCVSKCDSPGFRSGWRGRHDFGHRTEYVCEVDDHSFADHRLWQDVYHVPARGMELYMKFQADIVTEFVVMAFKER
jgi:hypothetical protein